MVLVHLSRNTGFCTLVPEVFFCYEERREKRGEERRREERGARSEERGERREERGERRVPIRELGSRSADPASSDPAHNTWVLKLMQ